MSFKVVLGGYEDVIHIYEEFCGVFISEVSEHLHHRATKGGWGVGETKKHYSGLEQLKRGFESRFPLIFFSDVYVLISSLYVEFGKQLLSL